MDVYQEGGTVQEFLLKPRFSIMALILVALVIVLIYLYYIDNRVKQYSNNYINWIKNKALP
jgi:hypothetical protein